MNRGLFLVKTNISTLSISFLKLCAIIWEFTKPIALLLNIFIYFCMNGLQICIDIYRRNSTNEL